MKQVEIKEVIENLIFGKGKVIDCSLNGKCTGCGECCSNFLPVSQSEIDLIQKYVIENNIHPAKQMLVMQSSLTCPYFNGKKCLIYEVRPLICREFYCYKKMDIEMAKKFQKEEHISVNMWAIAEEIDKQLKRINNERIKRTM